MILFKCKVLDDKAQVVEVLQIAKNEDELAGNLKKIGLFFISAKKQRSSVKNPIAEFTIPFFKNLHRLIANNLDLITALNIVSQLFSNAESKLTVQYIILSIKSGVTFSGSLFPFKKYFDKLTIKSIEVSEKISNLAESIGKIIEHLEAEVNWKNRIKNAIRYPIILFSCILCVMAFWISVIVPKFAELLLEIGIEPPLITKIIIKFSDFISSYFVIIFGIIIVTIFWGFKTLTAEGTKEKFIKKIPILSNIRREMFAMNFFSSMEMMIREKIHLLECLDCVSDIGNSGKIEKITRFIMEGNNLSNAMKKSGLFCDYEIFVITAGEESGDLWPAFKSLTDMLKIKLEERSQKIISTIQPVMIVFIGILLVIIVYSIIIPMYSNLEIGV